MKRCSSNAEDGLPSSKKRSVSYVTFCKWKKELDVACKTMSWLECDTMYSGARRSVVKLKCKVCRKFEEKIVGRRNYSDKWIVGADSVRTSNIRDHSQTDQHVHAMFLLSKEQAIAAGLGPSSYAPIARLLNELSEDDKNMLQVKFDIAYFVATQRLAFTKYPALCELEARHGVKVGTSYVNENAGKTFCHFIAQSRRETLTENLAGAIFFSVLMDGTTDKGNVDDELFLIVWCNVEGSDEKVHSEMNFFAVARPESVSGQGLFECFQSSLKLIGISEINLEQCKFLVGVGTDGASSNVAAGGLKGLIERRIPWIYWNWCFAHRVELAIKDALSSSSFSLIDDMILRLYYIYEKSPKKCRKLLEIVNDLKQSLTFDDSGIKPVRVSGSRWVTHKLSAIKRVISKFGLYISHLVSLSADKSVKASDCAKLHGYCSKWLNSKYILGCAFYSDLLAPCATFSKTMQLDHLDVLGALLSLLQTLDEVKKLGSKSLTQWPTYAMVLKNIQNSSGQNIYQCQTLKKLDEAKDHFTLQCTHLCSMVTTCLKSRLEWSNLETTRDILSVLATHAPEKILEEEINDSSDLEHNKPTETSVYRLGIRFRVPLEEAGVNIEELQKEFHEVMLYASQFISLSTMSYQAVWWRLFHAPDSSSWSNVLTLVRLLFSLPVSNGKLERVFSVLKTIKSEKRSSLGNELLDDLLMLNTDAVPLNKFNPERSIDLWWRASRRRPNQHQRKDYIRRSSSTSGCTSDSTGNDADTEGQTDTDNSETLGAESAFSLNDWDDWLCPEEL